MRNIKILIGCVAFVAIAVVAAVNVSISLNKNQMALWALANVEALAGENEGGLANGESSNNILTCYNTVRISLKNPNKAEPIWVITFCNGCSVGNCYEYKDSGTCTINSGYHYV